MLENGYIKLHRSLANWRWYKEPKTLLLWIHLLLNANYEPRDMGDKTIERGQIATSLAGLAEQTGLSVKEVRTSLDRLKKTGEIAVWSNRHMTVITVNEYERYQSDGANQGQTEGKQMADQGQTEDRPRADSGQTEGNQRATMKERKEREESKKAKKEGAPELSERFSEPVVETVREWLAYKQERREAYKPVGLKSLLAEIENQIGAHGERAVCDVIRLSMANNWRGIVWDRIESGGRKPTAQGITGQQLSEWETQWRDRVKQQLEARRGAGG